jgi:hypothetical protein
MTWLEQFCGLQQATHDPYRYFSGGSLQQQSEWGRQQRDAYNRAASQLPKPSPLDEALAYFRREGLTDEQIRKAITPALFAALREVKK